MLAKGNIFVPDPIFVFPDIFTCEYISTFSPISTFGPITVYGPILTLFEIFAFLWWDKPFLEISPTGTVKIAKISKFKA